MRWLDGKVLSRQIKKEILEESQAFQRQHRRRPGLAVVLVGDDPASQVYVANKLKAAAEVEFASFETRLPSSAKEADVRAAIEKFNRDADVDGILLQLPLPKGLSAERLLEGLRPEKDPDCLTVENIGRLWAGQPRTTPCTPWGVMEMLRREKIPLAGRHAVVIGPMAHLLLSADATVTICHSKTRDLSRITRDADVVVVAAGRPEFLGRDDFKAGATVIDVGIHRVPDPAHREPSGKTRLCGDVRTKEVEGWVGALTPVPGGVGPMTIAMLLKNTMALARAHAGG
jgi:methylenetetrahydrofolate dehydrogenase (NADP+) / methenyltetrahydrofolate cyclohydrolase